MKESSKELGEYDAKGAIISLSQSFVDRANAKKSEFASYTSTKMAPFLRFNIDPHFKRQK
jgi:hypothetical protein